MNLLHYGLQRSGTNFLESLMRKNFKVRFLNENEDRTSARHKHCRFYSDKNLVPEHQFRNELHPQTLADFERLVGASADSYLIVSKDPYSWYLSYRKWARKCNWPPVDHHYIEEYNLFYRTFMDLSQGSDKFHFVKYISLVQDTSETMCKLERELKLERQFFSRSKFRIPKAVAQSRAFSEMHRRYYLDQAYFGEYEESEIRDINERIDPAVLSFLGYEARPA